MTPDYWVVIATLAIILAFSLLLIWYLNNQNAPVRTTVLQLSSSVVFLLVIFLLAFLDKINGDTISTLMGAYVGYVFGKASSKGEWGDK